jgi:hypothetical protein
LGGEVNQMTDSKLITFDTSIIDRVTAEGDKFVFDPTAEEVLLKWEAFKESIEKADEILKEKLGEKMSALNTKRIDGAEIKVMKSAFGSRFEMTDPDLCLQLGLAVTKTSVSIDSKAVDKIMKQGGELPAGLKLKERVEKVSIRKSTKAIESGEAE